MKLRKYYIIDIIKINRVPTQRVRGTTMCSTSRVQFMAQALGCQLMRHLPASLKENKDTLGEEQAKTSVPE